MKLNSKLRTITNMEELQKMVSYKYESELISLLANLNPNIEANGLRENNQSLVSNGVICINVLSGTAEMKVNGDLVSLSVGSCICILNDSEIEFRSHSDGFRYFSFLYTSQLVETLYAETQQSYYKASMRHSYVVRQFDATDMEYRFQLFRELGIQMSMRENPVRKEVILSYATILFANDFEMFNHSVKLTEKQEAKELVSKQQVLFQQFIDLLNENSDHERSVKFYASTLGITPKYLSALSINYSGKNASAWIDEYVVSHAKRLLYERKYNIREVSIKLNFPSQSFFGRYFKRVSGLSPKSFIEQNINKIED